ncbi:MAG: hypothetical protein LLG04_08095, partial [Parachlamydia sp.]|nr:hypothetical protein [Parachlamydia sp.]
MQPAQSRQMTVAVIYPKGIVFNPDSNKDQIRVSYQWTYCRDGMRHSKKWGEDLSLQAALEVFRIVGCEEPARQLKDWVAKCHQDNPQRESYDTIPVDLQKKIALQLTGDEFLEDPLDQAGCEAKAAETGKVYTAPTSEQFLKTAAKSLAKFELPYKRELFLAKPEHLNALYMKHAGREQPPAMPMPVVTPSERVSMTQQLAKYISEEAQRTDVSLREVSRDELLGKVEER